MPKPPKKRAKRRTRTKKGVRRRGVNKRLTDVELIVHVALSDLENLEGRLALICTRAEEALSILGPIVSKALAEADDDIPF